MIKFLLSLLLSSLSLFSYAGVVCVSGVEVDEANLTSSSCPPDAGNCYVGSCQEGGASSPSPGDIALALAAGVALALAAGAAFLTLSVPAAVAATAALAIHAAVGLAVFGPGSSPTTAPPPAATAADAANPAGAPIYVNLSPVATTPSPSDAGTAPTVVVTPTGFAPSGGGVNTGGAEGGWNTGGATGSWDYTPPATASNPTPSVTASITGGGSTFSQVVPAAAGGSAVSSVSLGSSASGTPSPTGGVAVTTMSQVPVLTASGNPDTVSAASTVTYSGSTSGAGTPTGSTANVGSVTAGGVSTAGGSGVTFVAPGGTSPVSDGGGGGGGVSCALTNTCPVGDGGGGSCDSGDCSTESTQLANNALLSAIASSTAANKTALDAIKGKLTTDATVGDPDATTMSQVKGAGLSRNTGPFAALDGWSLPSHSSICPTSSFAWNNQTFTFDAHCSLIGDNFAVFRSVMTALFTLSALFIVLKA